MGRLPKTEIAFRALLSVAAIGLGGLLLAQQYLSRPAGEREPLPELLERLDRAERIGYYDDAPAAIKAKLLLGRAKQVKGDARRAYLTMADEELTRVIRAQPLNGRAWALKLWVGEALWGPPPAAP